MAKKTIKINYTYNTDSEADLITLQLIKALATNGLFKTDLKTFNSLKNKALNNYLDGED